MAGLAYWRISAVPLRTYPCRCQLPALFRPMIEVLLFANVGTVVRTAWQSLFPSEYTIASLPLSFKSLSRRDWTTYHLSIKTMEANELKFLRKEELFQFQLYCRTGKQRSQFNFIMEVDNRGSLVKINVISPHFCRIDQHAAFVRISSYLSYIAQGPCGNSNNVNQFNFVRAPLFSIFRSFKSSTLIIDYSPMDLFKRRLIHYINDRRMVDRNESGPWFITLNHVQTMYIPINILWARSPNKDVGQPSLIDCGSMFQ